LAGHTEDRRSVRMAAVAASHRSLHYWLFD